MSSHSTCKPLAMVKNIRWGGVQEMETNLWTSWFPYHSKGRAKQDSSNWLLLPSSTGRRGFPQQSYQEAPWLVSPSLSLAARWSARFLQQEPHKSYKPAVWHTGQELRRPLCRWTGMVWCLIKNTLSESNAHLNPKCQVSLSKFPGLFELQLPSTQWLVTDSGIHRYWVQVTPTAVSWVTCLPVWCHGLPHSKWSKDICSQAKSSVIPPLMWIQRHSNFSFVRSQLYGFAKTQTASKQCIWNGGVILLSEKKRDEGSTQLKDAHFPVPQVKLKWDQSTEDKIGGAGHQRAF